MGMCGHRITQNSFEEFLATSWEVSTEADRIGYRLKGPTFDFQPGERHLALGLTPRTLSISAIRLAQSRFRAA